MSQQINLYEERLRPRLELATERNVGIAALVLLVAMAGWSLWEGAEADRRSAAAEASLKEVVAAQEKMKALTQTMAERKVSPELANEVESAKSMVAAREDVIKVLDSGALGRTAGFSSRSHPPPTSSCAPSTAPICTTCCSPRWRRAPCSGDDESAPSRTEPSKPTTAAASPPT